MPVKVLRSHGIASSTSEHCHGAALHFAARIGFEEAHEQQIGRRHGQEQLKLLRRVRGLDA